ncbi:MULTISPECIES: SpoIIE family protein phosphatase [unclassified Streptomyces]|uniref:PP2C family protein-serine/threonine phosphatase n=1 Tax=unclassified Streptomyces TaxID=2593676 RepID=UPI000DB918CD|nr:MULTISPECIES: SpoIIE family protein phosphatase [unclassified Streptomyces]MYT68927.1 SpoIIE family protein phosphatase [Streptomyces sp. SID8367]RAJ82434.1 serine phosphatase RsbU (regulator of sigma subunit) [Streptomyces sp. PsTaAH-137]
MPPHVFADRPAGQPPERGTVDALIDQTRRLLGDVDAVRRDSVDAAPDETAPEARWQRALYELAVHQLSDLDRHLAQLREGPALRNGVPPQRPAAEPPSGSLVTRVGSADWNLLTDEAHWSGELYEILGRDPASPALTLDELSAVVHADDQPKLTAMVTDCLIDGKPIDGEFRIVRPDDTVRAVHMMGEPVLDADGSTASMWAVVRDVSELRRSQRAVSETRDSLQRQRHIAQTEHRLAVELQEAVLPPWRGSLRLPHGGPGGLHVAARYLPSSTGTPTGGNWYDALELPDGKTLLTVGDLTGQGVAVTSGMAMLLGAVRGMAVCDAPPAELLGRLGHLLDNAVRPALGSALCCRYDPADRTLAWAQAGHPAPLLFRDGTGRALTPPRGVLLGATSGPEYEQADVRLHSGDVLLLHTDALVPRRGEKAAAGRLLALAPRLAQARDAQECVRVVTDAFGSGEREDDACVLIARIDS